MTTHTHPEAAILCKCREMILLLNVHLNHFPKHEKYGLCQSIRQAAYDVYALLAECQKRYHNKTSLSKLDVRHEQLRMLINLSFELGYYDFHNHKRDRGDAEAQRRFVRKHSLFRFSRSLKAGDVPSLNSILGNASRTASHAHMCKRLRGERPDLFPELREAGSSFRGAVLAAKPVFDPKPSAVRESSGATRFAANSYEAPGFIESSELVPVLHGFSGSNVERNRNTLAYTGSCEGNRVFDNKPQVGRRRLDFV